MTFNNEVINIETRREKILDILAEKGRVKVSDLSKRFNISEVTIRNDLAYLEKHMLLERVHGGAVSSYKSYMKMTVKQRMESNREKKIKIVKKAVENINDGDTVILNSGTTVFYLALELINYNNITIITNSISIANEVGMQNNINVILLGGCVDTKYMYTYGEDTILQLKRYKANKLFLSVDGINDKEGITTYQNQEAFIDRCMIERTDRTFIIADSSKIGRTGFVNIGNINMTDMLITNKDANQNQIKSIRKKGVLVKEV